MVEFLVGFIALVAIIAAIALLCWIAGQIYAKIARETIDNIDAIFGGFIIWIGLAMLAVIGVAAVRFMHELGRTILG